MRRFFLAGVLLAAAAASAAAGACEAGWLDQYETDWGFARERWVDACERGLDPAAALREAQSAFIKECRARFARPDAAGKVPPALSEVHCAMGRAGRARLYAMAGLPDETAPKTGAPAVLAQTIPPPGLSNMGPLMPSLKKARAAWHPDACFSGLFYKYVLTPFADEKEWKRAKERREDPHFSRTFLEEYTYYFQSAQVGADTGLYWVSYGDQIESTFCTKIDRMVGPDSFGTPPEPQFGRCLSGVETDLDKALSKVFPGGAPSQRLTAYLAVLTAADLDGPRCFVADDFQHRDQRPCATLKAALTKPLKRARGGPVWLILHGGRTDLVDAGSGELLGHVPGLLLSGDGAGSVLYADKCIAHEAREAQE